MKSFFQFNEDIETRRQELRQKQLDQILASKEDQKLAQRKSIERQEKMQKEKDLEKLKNEIKQELKQEL